MGGGGRDAEEDSTSINNEARISLSLIGMESPAATGHYSTLSYLNCKCKTLRRGVELRKKACGPWEMVSLYSGRRVLMMDRRDMIRDRRYKVEMKVAASVEI